MKPPLRVRAFSTDERDFLTTSLRSRDAFTVRRAQILLAYAEGEEGKIVAQIAQSLRIAFAC